MRKTTIRIPTLLFAALLLTAACSKSDPAVNAGDAGSTTSAAPTSSTKASSPTTTGSGTSTGATPKDSAGFQKQLKDNYGITFTSDQGSCLGDGFVAKPDLFQMLAQSTTPTAGQTKQFVDLYVKCLGGVPGAVHAIVQMDAKKSKFSDPQEKCVEAAMTKLSPDDLVKLLGQDQATEDQIGPDLKACATAK
jgi:hypothetical protein